MVNGVLPKAVVAYNIQDVGYTLCLYPGFQSLQLAINNLITVTGVRLVTCHEARCSKKEASEETKLSQKFAHTCFKTPQINRVSPEPILEPL